MEESSRTVLYICHTLIDITCTGETRVDGKRRNQQRNYETLLQIISLRAQPIYLEKPELFSGDVSKYQFGSDFQGSHNIWSIVFGVEHRDIFLLNDNPVELLMQDINHTPVIGNLDNTAEFRTNIFSSYFDSKNTYFTIN